MMADARLFDVVKLQVCKSFEIIWILYEEVIKLIDYLHPKPVLKVPNL